MNKLTFKVPVLTKLEEFVWKHQDAPAAQLATELNRTEQAISAAYSRALAKKTEIEAIRLYNLAEKD